MRFLFELDVVRRTNVVACEIRLLAGAVQQIRVDIACELEHLPRDVTQQDRLLSSSPGLHFRTLLVFRAGRLLYPVNRSSDVPVKTKLAQ